VAPVRIRLTGIRAAGHHGANPGERDQPQEFEVDLEVLVDARGDRIDDTTDYRVLRETVQRTVAEQSHQLVETIARSVVDAVRVDPRVLSATAVVHKPAATRSLGVADVAVEATWSA
jgi:dihydroneopterin aldolase